MAFAGPTMSDTLAAVLHRDPDWTALPPTLPPAVTTLLRRCLEKDVRQRRRDIGDVRAELDDAAAQPNPAAAPPLVRRAASQRLLPWAIAVAGVAVAAGLGAWASGRWSRPGPEARVRQITDLVGMEEMPAISPDGKDVAFVAPVDGRRQIWLRRLGGGPAHQITADDVDHDHPRWTPDSSALEYFTPPLKEGGAGTLWEIPALGGMAARKLAQAATGADVSHNGLRLATFQKSAGGTALTILDRGGAQVKTISVGPAVEYLAPRWSPDDSSIAFIANEGNLVYVIYVIDIGDGKTREVARAAALKGLAWLPDGTGLVYASAAGSTLRYPPVFTLRTGVAARRQRTAAHDRRRVLRGSRHRTTRKDLRELHQDAVGYLAVSGLGYPCRERSERNAAHPPDGTGADTVAKPRRQGNRVPLQQRRSRERLGGECRRHRHPEAAHD